MGSLPLFGNCMRHSGIVCFCYVDKVSSDCPKEIIRRKVEKVMEQDGAEQDVLDLPRLGKVARVAEFGSMAARPVNRKLLMLLTVLTPSRVGRALEE